MLLVILSFCLGCKSQKKSNKKADYGNLVFVSKLSKKINEASGVEILKGSDLLWIHNDSGNSPVVYGVSKKGKIKKEIRINAKNNDWEDITTDDKGNLYIADIGNNANKRKNLSILKIKHQDLISQKNDKVLDVEHIYFYYPSQTEFPPSKNNRFFDAESLIFFKGNCYIFTKSRVKNAHGKTSLYKIPARAGNYKAELIATFSTGESLLSSVTGADISADGKKVALLTYDAVWIFSDFKGDNFFSGQKKRFPLNYNSQTEGVCFKDENTLYIDDEKNFRKGGNLYEINLK